MQGREASNLEPSDSESDALPVELHPWHDVVPRDLTLTPHLCQKISMTTGIAGAALKEHGAKKEAEHEALLLKVRKLREEGLTFTTIGTRLGISQSRAAELFNHPKPWKAAR